MRKGPANDLVAVSSSNDTTIRLTRNNSGDQSPTSWEFGSPIDDIHKIWSRVRYLVSTFLSCTIRIQTGGNKALRWSGNLMILDFFFRWPGMLSLCIQCSLRRCSNSPGDTLKGGVGGTTNIGWCRLGSYPSWSTGSASSLNKECSSKMWCWPQNRICHYSIQICGVRHDFLISEYSAGAGQFFFPRLAPDQKSRRVLENTKADTRSDWGASMVEEGIRQHAVSTPENATCALCNLEALRPKRDNYNSIAIHTFSESYQSHSWGWAMRAYIHTLDFSLIIRMELARWTTNFLIMLRIGNTRRIPASEYRYLNHQVGNLEPGATEHKHWTRITVAIRYARRWRSISIS